MKCVSPLGGVAIQQINGCASICQPGCGRAAYSTEIQSSTIRGSRLHSSRSNDGSSVAGRTIQLAQGHVITRPHGRRGSRMTEPAHGKVGGCRSLPVARQAVAEPIGGEVVAIAVHARGDNVDPGRRVRRPRIKTIECPAAIPTHRKALPSVNVDKRAAWWLGCRSDTFDRGQMPIFIPVFIGLFIVVPAFLTKMAADLLQIRGFMAKLILFMVIAGLNWQYWQAPKTPGVGWPATSQPVKR